MSITEAPSVPKFYFVDEAAAALRRSVAATQYLIHSGQLKSSKLGGRRVVTQAQLDEFFADALGPDAA
jgi:hypothetical protein